MRWLAAAAMTAAAAITPGCRDQVSPTCGDGVVDLGEECDDGNRSITDDCLPDCRRARCGDLAVRSDPADPADREECDVGGVETAGCDDDCTAVVCGDHHRNSLAGEACDDGNQQDGDGCASDCRSDESCGNGIVDDRLPGNPGNDADCLTADLQDTNCAEVCDDGNRRSGDGCSANCLSTEICGNGILDLGEVCDDGNGIDGDACPTTCTSDVPGWVCGDGLVYPELEECDPGFETASCDLSPFALDPQNCTFARCGDLYVNTAAGEQCDDGNQSLTDDCVACRDAVCGDGAVDLQPPDVEECDLGPLNGTAGAGCSATCTRVAP